MDARKLLLSRYKLISEYPFCELSVGEIVGSDETGGISLGGRSITDDEMSRYSSNFKRLKWWEERDMKDLPSHVKHTVSGKTGKVDKWDLKSSGSGGVQTGSSFWLLQYIVPASEDEI